MVRIIDQTHVAYADNNMDLLQQVYNTGMEPAGIAREKGTISHTTMCPDHVRDLEGMTRTGRLRVRGRTWGRPESYPVPT